MFAEDLAKAAAAAGNEGGGANIAEVMASFSARKRFIKARHVPASFCE
jgi:hypothetical protein